MSASETKVLRNNFRAGLPLEKRIHLHAKALGLAGGPQAASDGRPHPGDAQASIRARPRQHAWQRRSRDARYCYPEQKGNWQDFSEHPVSVYPDAPTPFENARPHY
jgi:hypothetical protein